MLSALLARRLTLQRPITPPVQVTVPEPFDITVPRPRIVPLPEPIEREVKAKEVNPIIFKNSLAKIEEEDVKRKEQVQGGSSQWLQALDYFSRVSPGERCDAVFGCLF